MREITYYRASTCLPVVVPLLLLGADIILRSWLDLHVPGGRIGGMLVGSFVIAGIPYLLFAAVALFLLRQRATPTYRRFAIAAPVLFVPVLCLYAVVAGAVSPHISLREQLGGVHLLLGYFALLVLPLGYAYVAIVLLSSALLQRAGLLERV